jgi:hypothetical protein
MSQRTARQRVKEGERGGRNTKVPALARGRLLAILLTGGEADDCPAERLIAPASQRFGDKADDCAELRQGLKDRGTRPILPNRRNKSR